MGDWEVFDTTGKKAVSNLILILQDSCVIQENWNSVGPYSGTSYNYYNSLDSLWHQAWVDNQGGNLNLYGTLQDQTMILRSDLVKGKKVDKYYNRISWIPNEDSSVRQIWEILNEK